MPVERDRCPEGNKGDEKPPGYYNDRASDSIMAIEAMKEGAFDYLTKPFEYDQLTEVIKRAIFRQDFSMRPLWRNETYQGWWDTIVGKSQLMPTYLNINSRRF